MQSRLRSDRSAPQAHPRVRRWSAFERRAPGPPRRRIAGKSAVVPGSATRGPLRTVPRMQLLGA